ncbi:MAG: hypothetical protein CM15mP21_5430 [Hyphomicrobiales bacterium]|nr:MAG: hypothetical protein CM15mP21_5430 [Hyphomicrobiales bacterium]
MQALKDFISRLRAIMEARLGDRRFSDGRLGCATAPACAVFGDCGWGFRVCFAGFDTARNQAVDE